MDIWSTSVLFPVESRRQWTQHMLRLNTHFMVTSMHYEMRLAPFFECPKLTQFFFWILDKLVEQVDVTMVCPGFVETDIIKNSQSRDVPKQFKFAPLSVARCARLTLLAMATKSNEVWLGTQPLLLSSYVCFYCPTLMNTILKLTARFNKKKQT